MWRSVVVVNVLSFAAVCSWIFDWSQSWSSSSSPESFIATGSFANVSESRIGGGNVTDDIDFQHLNDADKWTYTYDPSRLSLPQEAKDSISDGCAVAIDRDG